MDKKPTAPPASPDRARVAPIAGSTRPANVIAGAAAMALRAPLTRSAPAGADPDERRQPQAGGRGERSLSVTPDSYDATARTVEVVLSAGTGVRRYYFTEELAIEAGAIDLARVDGGVCPLLDTHNQYQLDGVIGRVLSARIENGQLLGIVAFADTPAGRAIEARVASGELRAISIGYRVTAWERVAIDDNDHETWRATRWELLEASLVPVPADPNAVVRSAPGTPTHGNQEENDEMRRNLAGGAAAAALATAAAPTAPAGTTGTEQRQEPAAPTSPAQQQRQEPTAPATVDATVVVTSARNAGLDADAREALLIRHATTPFTRDALMADIGARFAERDSSAQTVNRVPAAAGDNTTMARAMSDAVLHRLSPGSQLPEASRNFRGMGLLRMAEELLGSSGISTRGMTAHEIAERALHTTSDFPALMGNAMNRRLTGGIIILTTLVGKYLESADAAKKAEAAKRADSAATNTLEGAIKQLNEVTGNYNRSQATTIELAISNANMQIKLAEGIRTTTAARVADMKALQAANRQRASGPGQSSEIAALGLSDGDKAIADAEATLLRLDANLIRGRNAVRAASAEARRVRADETASKIDGDARLVVSTGRVADAERALRQVEKDGRRDLAAGTITEDQYRDRRLAAERRLIAAQDASKGGGEAQARSLARQASAMEVNADAALDLARAYLVGSDAALRAEAARKGLTDATRKGIDSDAQVRRQLAIMVGDEVVAGAKSVAKLRDEADARVAVRKEIQAGVWTWDQASDALAEEAALRPLLKLQTVAQGDALKALTEVIDQYRVALRRARQEEMDDTASRAAAAAQDRAAELRSQIADLPLSEADRRRNADQRAAIAEADRQKFTGDARKSFLGNKRTESEAGIDFDRARFVSEMVAGQKDSLTMATAELRLAAANDNVRQASLAKVRLMLDLKRAGVDLDGVEGRLIIENADSYDAIIEKLREQRNAWDEMRSFGESFVDTVLSPKTWENWGDGGKAILNMLKEEFLKLALINPIKNLLFGGDGATLGSLLGGLGRLVGGSGTAALPAGGSQGFVGPPGNAAGTHYWTGGQTLVGEHGSEIVDLPRGSRITPAGETRRLLAANDAGPAQRIQHFDLRGAFVTEKLYADMQAIGDAAAIRGAAGGAQMGYSETKARAGRRLGKRWG